MDNDIIISRYGYRGRTRAAESRRIDCDRGFPAVSRSRQCARDVKFRRGGNESVNNIIAIM